MAVRDYIKAVTDYITEEEIYLFNRGELYHSYLRFGAHKIEFDGIEGVHFAVWAPNAVKVCVVGNFNSWQGQAHTMKRKGESGVWTLFVPGLKEGEIYKYEIHTREGQVLLKADPFAFYSELRPNTASIVYSLEGYEWKDGDWFKKKKKKLPSGTAAADL